MTFLWLISWVALLGQVTFAVFSLGESYCLLKAVLTTRSCGCDIPAHDAVEP